MKTQYELINEYRNRGPQMSDISELIKKENYISPNEELFNLFIDKK